MENPSLRVRLEFGDRSILSKTQRSNGMNKSWLLLKLHQQRTISDVCTHLLHIFKLHRSCPNGILLSMEGFVLPPFESTEILKDKELICVKKKGGATADAGNLLGDVEVDDLELENNDMLLLANENFDNGNEEDQNEIEEDDEEDSQDEEDLPEEPVPKKRKAPVKLQNSKNKRQCLEVLNDNEKEKLDNVKNVDQVNEVSAPGAKKMPSRSARRKKAKRQWMRELAKISKKKPQQYSKPEAVTKTMNKEDDGQPKGLLHWKHASKKAAHKNTVEQQKNRDVSGVTKPGHIRFDNLDEDQTVKQTGASNESFRWNGSNGKRKGQRWSNGKFSNFKRNESKIVIDKKAFRVPITDTQVPVIDPNDFSKLPPCCSPKEGDVIAYRLLELSSSWIPEFSSFRVGRISYYDARDIVLIPVPEYPLVTDEIRPNDSLYGEDGSLEINYSALLDVCYVKPYEAVTNDVQQAPVSDDKDGTENMESNSNDNTTNVSNPWDQLCKANSNTDVPVPLPLPGVNHSSMVGGGDPGPSEVVPENNDKGIMGNPWVSSNHQEPSQENQSSLTGGWTPLKNVGTSDNNCGQGSSWGRPWSSFAASRGSSVKSQPNNQNEWGSSSSRGNGRTWTARGGPRGRGRGGRGRGRNA